MKRKQAMRQCAVCKVSHPQSFLIRIGVTDEQELRVVRSKADCMRLRGRSTYVCPTHDCIAGLIARPARISQALRRPMSSHDRAVLIEQLETLMSGLSHATISPTR